ncbi:hypothetical protein AAFF_G00018830 [Aldrovandia affinis]|uniref:Uncharacterized protein n=1 Tax=Aldrovandia affinis TaxID=143900 RepID=A0AAD7S7M2_9TELE|nr:hypothetical protein AAFF_G00018830 [Aldrovandia affinis]
MVPQTKGHFRTSSGQGARGRGQAPLPLAQTPFGGGRQKRKSLWPSALSAEDYTSQPASVSFSQRSGAELQALLWVTFVSDRRAVSTHTHGSERFKANSFSRASHQPFYSPSLEILETISLCCCSDGPAVCACRGARGSTLLPGHIAERGEERRGGSACTHWLLIDREGRGRDRLCRTVAPVSGASSAARLWNVKRIRQLLSSPE